MGAQTDEETGASFQYVGKLAETVPDGTTRIRVETGQRLQRAVTSTEISCCSHCHIRRTACHRENALRNFKALCRPTDGRQSVDGHRYQLCALQESARQ